MNLLALELSSPRASVAWLDSGTGKHAEVSWDRGRTQTSDLFLHVNELLRQAGCAISAIDLFVAGRGPGNFSGMRMALSASLGMALPFHREVRSISSGRAAAAELFTRHPLAQRVAVMGDARRGVCWAAAFDRTSAPFPPPTEWLLLPPHEARTLAASAHIVGSSEIERLEKLLAGQTDHATPLVALFPSALCLARIASYEIDQGINAEPITPLYLHPPVA